MRRHFAYARYLTRHKWNVMVECFRHGLIWRGIRHDWSKYRPSEWFPYAAFFYTPSEQKTVKRDSTGYYKPTDTGDAAFDFAWLLHQKRNRHHWQWWVLPEDDGGTKVLEMPDVYIKEMVCDWIGAGLAQGHGRDVVTWYDKNKEKMQLTSTTRRRVESLIGLWV